MVDKRRARGGRATWLGSPSRVSAVIALVVIVPLTGLVWSSESGRSNLDTYGALPSWLPSSSVPTNRIVSATIEHPQLGIGGSTFMVTVGGAKTLVTMSGPQTPAFVTPPPPTTRATFTITFAKTSRALALDARDFGIIDGKGDVFYPKTFVGGAAHTVATSGKVISVEVSEVMATGTGSIAWAPDGKHPVVTWEYTLEND
jgi:hypothetical protein